MFLPVMALLMLAIAVGVISRWKETPVRWLGRMLFPVLLGSLMVGLAIAILHDHSRWSAAAVCLLAAWILFACLRDVLDKTRHQGLSKGLPMLSRSYWGMHLAHLGFVVCAVGVVLASVGREEGDVRRT